MAQSLEQFKREWENGKDYIVSHTSGSTGAPKEIHLPKADMLSSARATNKFFGIDAGSVLALPLSMDYIAGKMMAVRAFAAGCRLEILPVSNSVKVAGRMDLLSVVPTQLESLLADSGSRENVRNLLIGGAPMTADMEREVVRSGISAWLGFGMTETCSHIALRRVGGDGVFGAMPDVEFSVDEDSCLQIKSPRFSWQELTTRDVVELVDPTHFRWLGRADNVVNSGGIKLHPEEIESRLVLALPSIPSFYLRGEPDDALGSKLVMVAENPPENLLDELRQVIPDHKILPKRIIAVERLPRTANGKIKRI